MIKKTITYITSIIPSPLPGKLFTILPESFQFFSPVHSCILTITLREKCPNTDVFLVHKVAIKNENFFVLIVSCLSTHQGKNFTLKEVFLVRIFPYSVQIQENTDHKDLRIWSLFTPSPFILYLIAESECFI